MADPITWRNVTGPSLADASRPLQVAQQTISSGLANFNDLLKQQEATDQANWEQVKKNNTNEFMNKLYEAQNAEQFGRMNDGNAMGRMLTGFGAQIDQAAARQALDSRLSTLQDRDVNRINFNHTMLDEQQAPLLREIQILNLTDPKAAKAKLDEHPELRKSVELATGIDAREWLNKERGWKEELHPLEVQSKKADINYKGAQTTLANAQADHAKATADRERAYIDALKAGGFGGGGTVNADGTVTPNNSGNANAVKIIDKAWEEMVKRGVYGKGDYTANPDDLAKELRDKKIPETEIQDILYNVSKYYKNGAVVGHELIDDPKRGVKKGDPIRAPLPISTVLQAVDQATDGAFLPGWSRRGDSTVNILDDWFGVDKNGAKKSSDTYRADIVRDMAAINDMRAQRDARLAGPAVPTLIEQSTNPDTWKKAPPKGKSVMFPKPR